MPGRRPFLPALPLPRRSLPWILFALGVGSIAYGAVTRDFAGLTIGVIATGGALLSWAAELLLRNPSEPGE